MTKWHKYRDIKPNIKSIMKSKENSHNSINERKVKTRSERLFLILNNDDENKKSSEEILNRYKDFSTQHKSIWIPIDLPYENELTRDMSTRNDLNLEKELNVDKKIEELIVRLSVAVKNHEILWMYIDIDKKVLEDDEIQSKAKVIDIKLSGVSITTPDKKLTIASDQDHRSNMWVKVSTIKKCGGVRRRGLQIIASEINLKEVMLKSQSRFYIVEKTKK